MKLFLLLPSLLLLLPSLPAMADEAPLRLCARYSVWLPGDREELKQFNRYVLRSYEIDRSRPGRERMSFALPGDLTGDKRVAVHLTVRSQVGNTRELTGPMGAATCTGPWTAMSCNFRFRELDLDLKAVGSFLTKKYGNTARRDGLLDIAASFSGDPIGVAHTAVLDESCR